MPKQVSSSEVPNGPKRRDRFVEGLKERLPEGIGKTFSAEQLEALREVFGTRGWQKHPVDIRTGIRMFRHKYYLVLLAGRGPNGGGKRSWLQRLVLGIFLLGGVTLALILTVLVLYVIKSALNVDFIPDFSFGVWDFIKDLCHLKDD